MKKLLSVLLTLVIALGMTVNASAVLPVTGGSGGTSGAHHVDVMGGITSSPPALKSNTKIRIDADNFETVLEQEADNGLIAIYKNGTPTAITDIEDLENLAVSGGDELRIAISGGMFVGHAGESVGDYRTNVPRSTLTNNTITVKVAAQTNPAAESISIEGNSTKSYISVKFSNAIRTSKERFTYTLYFYDNGKRSTATKITLKGALESDIIGVDAGDDYYDLSTGDTIKAESTIRSMELYLGNNCTVTKPLARGNIYAGKAIVDPLRAEEYLFTKYSDLAYIYRLETVNLKSQANVVTFDFGRNTFYVYNTNGSYIGTTDQALPYWTKYYLTTYKYPKIQK